MFIDRDKKWWCKWLTVSPSPMLEDVRHRIQYWTHRTVQPLEISLFPLNFYFLVFNLSWISDHSFCPNRLKYKGFRGRNHVLFIILFSPVLSITPYIGLIYFIPWRCSHFCFWAAVMFPQIISFLYPSYLVRTHLRVPMNDSTPNPWHLFRASSTFPKPLCS